MENFSFDSFLSVKNRVSLTCDVVISKYGDYKRCGIDALLTSSRIHCAISRKFSNKILYFIKDCDRTRKDFIGSNIKIRGLKLKHFTFIWTHDEASFVNGRWDKTMDDLEPIKEPSNIEITQQDIVFAKRVREDIADLSYQQLEHYIDDNVTNLHSAKAYLMKLSKVVLAMCKIMDRRL